MAFAPSFVREGKLHGAPTFASSLKKTRDKPKNRHLVTNNPKNWAEAYNEIYISNRFSANMRGKKTIPILEKPNKPKDMIGTFGNEIPVHPGEEALK